MAFYTFKWSTADADGASVVVRNAVGDVVASGSIPDEVSTTNEAFVSYSVDLPAGDTYVAAATLPDGRQRTATGVLDHTSPAALSATFALKGEGGGSAMLWELRQNLRAGLTDITIGNSGDSVSTDITEWLGLTVSALADEFPAYTVIWHQKNDGADTYAAPVTIQTGTGSKTLRVYNWSQSGASTTVGLASDAVFEVAFPTALDYLFISTGHNDDVDAGLDSWHTRELRWSLDRVLTYYPMCQVGVVLINPKAPTDPRYTEGLMAHRGLVVAAGLLGMEVIDLSKAWHSRPGGYTSLIPDGTHPNAAGHEFLRDTFLDLFHASTGATTPVRPRFREESVFVPLMGGFAHTGSPAPAIAGGYMHGAGIAFDQTTVEKWITPYFELPSWWNSVMIDVIWTPQGSATGGIRVQIERIGVQSDALPAPLSAAELVTATLTMTDGAKFGQVFETTVVNASPPAAFAANWKRNNRYPGAGAPWPFQLRVSRLATDGADTYTDDVLIHGIRFRRYA